MEFRILGPLEAWDGESEVRLSGRKPRALLALLLLHPNEIVPADRLVDELWGEDPPEHVFDALRVNVSRLRKVLPPNVVTTRSPGYAVRVDADALDLHRFERLLERGAWHQPCVRAEQRLSRLFAVGPRRALVGGIRLGLVDVDLHVSHGSSGG